MAAVANVSLAAAGEPAREDAADVFNSLAHPSHGDPRTDRVLLERDGQLVAHTGAGWRDHASGALEVDIALVLAPDLDPLAVGRPLLEWAFARGRQFGTGQPPERARWFAAWCGDGETWTRAALEAAGFRPQRHFHLLERPTLTDLPPAPPLPPGLEVRAVLPKHWRQVWQADLEAFRDHWGTPDESEAGFARFQGEHAQRPDLWQVAWAGDEVAGHVLVAVHEEENAALGVNRGWLDSVAVRRPWRRQGLASALVGRALHALREAGYEAAVLGVDAENPNQAVELYRRAGFEVTSAATSYRRTFEG
jgi:mycothiol synthase